MKTTLAILAIIVSICLIWNLAAYRDIDFLKANAPEYLTNKMGYKIIGQDAFEGGLYYGGRVWYQVIRPETPNLIYEIAVVEWRGEIQSYQPTVINTNILIHN